jgi:plastocyanin
MVRVNSWINLMVISLLSSLVLLMMGDHDHTYAQQEGEATKVVHAGEGNASVVTVAFLPPNIEVKVGESVQWINPTEVAEPHSVTFLKDKKYFAEFAAPFRVANSTDFQPLVSNSNSEPVFLPGQPGETTKTVVTVNARAVIPAVLDSSGEKVSYLEPNSNYTMNGTESYVNSGWLWPEGQAPPGGPPISKFTVTFEKSGTYPYLCNVHPWMTGSVTVK